MHELKHIAKFCALKLETFVTSRLSMLNPKGTEREEVCFPPGGFWLISLSTIVSQPSKWLKFMTFREGCFVMCN